MALYRISLLLCTFSRMKKTKMTLIMIPTVSLKITPKVRGK